MGSKDYCGIKYVFRPPVMFILQMANAQVVHPLEMLMNLIRPQLLNVPLSAQPATNDCTEPGRRNETLRAHACDVRLESMRRLVCE